MTLIRTHVHQLDNTMTELKIVSFFLWNGCYINGFENYVIDERGFRRFCLTNYGGAFCISKSKAYRCCTMYRCDMSTSLTLYTNRIGGKVHPVSLAITGPKMQYDHVHGPLARYVKVRIAHAPGMPGTFTPPPPGNNPGMHQDTCVTHVPWYMPGSLPSGFLWSRWREKRSRYSRHMCNAQFYVSGKRSMVKRSVFWKCTTA